MHPEEEEEEEEEGRKQQKYGNCGNYGRRHYEADARAGSSGGTSARALNTKIHGASESYFLILALLG